MNSINLILPIEEEAIVDPQLKISTSKIFRHHMLQFLTNVIQLLKWKTLKHYSPVTNF